MDMNTAFTISIWMGIINNRALQCDNVFWGICAQQRPRSACAFAQSDQGIHCPVTESLDTIECISGEQMPGWHFVHVWNEFESVHFAHARRHIFTWCGPHSVDQDQTANGAVWSGSTLSAIQPVDFRHITSSPNLLKIKNKYKGLR